MLTYLRANIFDSPAQTLVNTVNTVGVMGKGIAKEFKAVFPKMFDEYKILCDEKVLTIGTLHLWRSSTQWVLNFPTKKTWQKPSKIEYIEEGLKSFRENYREMGINSISFPPLGCGNGNLEWSSVRPVMEHYLKPLPIQIYIHDFQVASDFVPEHLESAKPIRVPSSYDQFLEDIKAELARRAGRFSTLSGGTPFSATLVEDGAILVRRGDDGHALRIQGEDIEAAWVFLQAGILSADQYSDDASRKAKSYFFPILASLPYVKLAAVKHARDESAATGHGLYLMRDVGRKASVVARGIGVQECLFQ